MANPLPLWTYNVTAYDGNPYSGTIIGLSPFNHGKTTTTIPTQIIPLVITIVDSNGTYVYDPTAPDACVPGHDGLDIIANSPMFTNNPWTMNGVNVGTTQYVDADMRAEFWQLVGNTPYHVTLQASTPASQSLAFGDGAPDGGTNYPVGWTPPGGTSPLSSCDPVGVVNVNDLVNAVEALITGPLAGTVNVGTLPVFLTENVLMADPGDTIFNECCAGLHSGFFVGQQAQLYSIFVVTSYMEYGGGYTGSIGHEIAETIHDPTGNNPTPPWGYIGQDPSFCQSNFEVADPLVGAGNWWEFYNENGISFYALPELAFFNWFYGDPNLAQSGNYSNNGSFTGHAKPCPPGGTN